jgi:hypothetical protein
VRISGKGGAVRTGLSCVNDDLYRPLCTSNGKEKVYGSNILLADRLSSSRVRVTASGSPSGVAARSVSPEPTPGLHSPELGDHEANGQDRETEISKSTLWWVITNPTNLYRQTDFPKAEQALIFHLGLGIYNRTKSLSVSVVCAVT